LHRAWGLTVGANNPSAGGVSDAVMRSLKPVHASPKENYFRYKNLRKFRQTVQVVPAGTFEDVTNADRVRPHPIKTDAGLWVMGNYSIQTDPADVKIFIEKMVRGMYWYLTKTALPRTASITAELIGRSGHEYHANWIKANKLNLLPLPPSLYVFFGIANDQPVGSFWYFYIWERILLCGASLPADDADPPNPA
jgi:hypothetical protein